MLKVRATFFLRPTFREISLHLVVLVEPRRRNSFEGVVRECPLKWPKSGEKCRDRGPNSDPRVPERAIHALCVFFGGNLHEICVESAFFQVGERGIFPGGSRSRRTHTSERERARRTERTQPRSAEENVILLGSLL
uniref:(northern house mosquito) hypothetical protein n=1 Tax=Culex pipiens TaxID=7175 RepID=A0A8D8G9R4_CULPI